MNSTTTHKRPLLKKKSTRVVLLILAAAFAAFWFVRPAPPPPSRGSGELMKAIVYHEYGSADVLRFEKIEKLLPNDNQVLIKVRAAAVNPLDWHYMRGTPYLMRMDAGLRKPKDMRLGVDLAGEVVAVGSSVTHFKPGDEVFGVGDGAFAEYVACFREQSRAETSRRHVRAGGGRAGRGIDRAAGPSRQGAYSAGAEGSDQRRIGRRGDVRRADRQIVRRGGHRRVQHAEMWSWSDRSAQTMSSTTPKRISRRARSGTT